MRLAGQAAALYGIHGADRESGPLLATLRDCVYELEGLASVQIA